MNRYRAIALYERSSLKSTIPQNGSPTLIIGLTGGIASGKSTVIEYALKQGAHVIDADKLGHQVYEPGTRGFEAVVSEFGTDIVAPDGTIDRKKLGSKVFADGGSLARLTDIVWPQIKTLAKAEIAEVQEQYPNRLVVLEAAVLIEAGWQDLVDEIWVVVVDEEAAISRAVQRDGVTREAIEARMSAQLSNEQRTKNADVILDNNHDQGHLQAQLKRQFSRLENERVHVT